MSDTPKPPTALPQMGQSPLGVFGRLATSVLTQSRRWVLALAVLTLAAVGLATQLTVNPNMLELLPKDHPTSQAIAELNAEEGGTNLVTLTVQGDDPATLDAWMRVLESRAGALDGVDYAVYSIPDDLGFQLGLLQLTTVESVAIRDRLKGAVALGPAAGNPFVASRLLDLGPLTARLNNAQSELPALSSGDGKARLVIRPTGSAYDARFAQPFMARLDALLEELDTPDDGVKVTWVGGAYRHSVEDVKTIQHDLGSTAGFSAVMVVVLIALAFRDLRATLLIFLPLVLANVWTTGVASLTVGSLNTFTSFYPAILIGLGVDFSIHLYSRFREERALSETVEAAIVRAWDLAGPPCFTAAVTSAGGFCALWVAGFGGFRQLGTLLAAGVLLCLAAVLVVLPLLIRWRNPPGVAAPQSGAGGPVDRSRYRLAPVGLATVIALAVLAMTQVPGVSFQYDLSALRQTGLGYDEMAPEIREAAVSSYAPVIVSFDDLDSLTAAHASAAAAIEAGDVKLVRGLLSFRSVVPADQDARLTVLQEVATLARHPNIGFLPPQVQANLGRIAKAQLSPITPADLPRPLRHLIGAGQDRFRLMVLPQGNQWDLRNNLALKTEIEALFPGQQAAGEYLALAVLYTLVQGDVPRVAGVAFLLVLVMSWIDLRSLPRALGAVLALAAGMAWAAAGMATLDVRLSVVNFVGIPILMGIGVDVIIHLLHRMREEGPGGVAVALKTTGWASGLSAATTVLSFASLSIATHQGVQSLGHLIVLGLSLVTLAGFLVIPLGWMTIWRKAPADPGA